MLPTLDYPVELFRNNVGTNCGPRSVAFQLMCYNHVGAFV